MTERQPARRPRHLPDESRRDRGFNFVEVVVTIALLGLVMVPVLAAVSALIRTSQVNESAAQVETLIVNAVDRVNRADRASYQCDYTPAIEAAVGTVGWPPTSVAVVHEHLGVVSGTWEPTGCPGGVVNPLLIQRVTITITNPDEGLTRSIQVVKGGI